MDEEPRNFEAPLTGIAAKTDELEMEFYSHDTQNSPDDGHGSKQAPELGGDQAYPAISAPTTEDKKQFAKLSQMGKKSSENLCQKRDAMIKAYEHLVGEESEIEKRTGLPSEKPSDKTRLAFLKQEIERIEIALDHNEVDEEMNIAEDMEVAQNSIGVPVKALRATPSKKPASTTRRTVSSTAKKRKDTTANVAVSAKKRKPNSAPKPAPKPASKSAPKPAPKPASKSASKPAPKPAPKPASKSASKPALNPALKRQLKDADAIGNYTFNQLSGKGATASETKNLKKILPSLKGLSKARRAIMKKIQAAAEKVEAKDTDTRARIDADVQGLMSMTKPFGKSCTLKLLRGEESSGEDRDIDDYAWAIEGMASALRHHQMVAAGYMCIIERAKKAKGGLLFDYMGYGKTVETLALVVGNPGNKDTKASGGATTLVVVPSAAASQWHEEVNVHCPGLVASLWTNPTNMRALMASDILVITYPQIRAAYKEAAGIQKWNKKNKDDDEKHSRPALKHPLFRTKFYRIVLDEMHEIKGYRNLTFDAVMALQAECKWGLTGTPTPNGIEEIFPYLKFIEHPDVDTMRKFKKTYVGGKGRTFIPEEVRFERLRELLTPVMIMRTPSQSFLGTTLLKLPKGHALPPIVIAFSPEEKIIYYSIKENIRDHIMKKAALKSKKVGWAALNESLIRLRQCVTSPLLLQNLAKEGFWSANDLASMKKGAREAGCKTTLFIDQIERWNVRSNLDRGSSTPGFVIPEKFIMDARAVLAMGTCPGHGCVRTTEQLIEPQKAECGHVWCKACLEKHIKFEKMIEQREIPVCSRCHKPIGQVNPFSPAGPANEVTERVDQDHTPQERPGADYNNILPRGSNLMVLLNQDLTMKMPRSGKVDAVIRQVLTWQKEAPGDKIIIFIQWVDLNGILGRILQEESIKFLYYAGRAEMSEKDRRAAIDTFKEDPVVKVLICSLRCGGQALNLTCANRTIMVDLWWNHSVEAQATARVYRMGQTKETYSVRILAEDSVDEKIYELQESKLEVIQNSFQEFESHKNLDKEALVKLAGDEMGWARDILGDDFEEYEEDFIDDDDLRDPDYCEN